jgi:serine/threonine protein kinase
MQRQLKRPTLEGMISTSNSQVVGIRSSAQQPEPHTVDSIGACAASYVVSASGAQLTLGGGFQVSSTGAREFNPVTGSVTHLGRETAMQYQLGLAANERSSLKCSHISELDFDNGILVGRGSSGRVYNVMHVPSGVRVCVKQMQIDDSRHREEVKRELDSLHKAASRFIVDFYGAFFHNDLGVILLVLELMNGSLYDVLKLRKVISEEEARAFAYQVTLGLHFLHAERRLLHRDIKPANLLFHRSGRVKITDFGVSSSGLGADENGPAQVHTFVGSIMYMSPERLNASSYSFESDIWSLGVTLCEAVVGCHPHVDDSHAGAAVTINFWELLQKVIRNDPEIHRSPIKRIPRRLVDVETISDEMDDFVAQCLKFDRTERATAASLLQHPWLANMNLEFAEGVVSRLASEIAVVEAADALRGSLHSSGEVPVANFLSTAASSVPVAASSHFSLSPPPRGAPHNSTTLGVVEAMTPEEKRQRSSQLLADLMASNQR